MDQQQKILQEAPLDSSVLFERTHIIQPCDPVDLKHTCIRNSKFSPDIDTLEQISYLVNLVGPRERVQKDSEPHSFSPLDRFLESY
jgi:hypothetical protein